MDKNLQKKFAQDLYEEYQKHAFECLANYDYFGRKYKKIEDEIAEMDRKKKQAEDEIKAIGDKPDYHTAANKERVKALKKDVEMYTKRIEGVAETFKGLYNLAVQLREKGVTYLEQADNILRFTLRTPEEIDKDKAVGR